jgi:hypothetical protein
MASGSNYNPRDERERFRRLGLDLRGQASIRGEMFTDLPTCQCAVPRMSISMDDRHQCLECAGWLTEKEYERRATEYGRHNPQQGQKR